MEDKFSQRILQSNMGSSIFEWFPMRSPSKMGQVDTALLNPSAGGPRNQGVVSHW